jgi:integrase
MMSIHDRAGGRKYLTEAERRRFLAAADAAPRDVRAFCHTLAWTGCRVSEALALTADRVDLAGATIIFESLKKRRRGLFRTVPIPPDLATMLDLVTLSRSYCGVQPLQLNAGVGCGELPVRFGVVVVAAVLPGGDFSD